MSFIQVAGQETISEERFLRFKAYETINEYSNRAVLKTKTDDEAFKRLFTQDARLVNDILPMNNSNSTLNIDDYLKTNYQIVDPEKSRVRLTITSIHLLKNIKNRNEGNITVEADKYLFLEGNNSGRNYLDTLSLVFHMEYHDTTVLINEILLAESSVKYFFIDIKNQGRGEGLSYDQQEFKSVIIDNQTYELSTTGTIFLIRNPQNKAFKLRIDDSKEYIARKRFQLDDFGEETVNALAEFTNKKNVRFKRKQFYTGGSGLLSFNNSIEKFGKDHTGTLQELGNDIQGSLGMILIHHRKRPIEVRAELGVINSSTKYNISVPEYEEDFVDVDTELHMYNRNVHLTNFEENGKVDYQAISSAVKCYVGLDSWISNLSVFAGLNYRSIISARHTYSSDAATLYAGQYNAEYYNVLIQENGVHDFGSHLIQTESENNLERLTSYTGYQFGLNYELSSRIEIEGYLNFTMSNKGMNTSFNDITQTAFRFESMYLNTQQSSFNSLNMGFRLNYYLK